MFCHQCGKKIPDGSAFCMFCGALLPTAPEEIESPFSVQEDDSFQFDSELFSDISISDDPIVSMPEKMEAPVPIERHCTVCGRLLPDSSISDVCVTCLYNRSFVAEELDPENAKKLFQLDLDLDSEYPQEFRGQAEAPPEKPNHPSKPPLKKVPRPLIIGVLILIVGALCFGGWKLVGALTNGGSQEQEGDSSSAPTISGTSNQEKKATLCAHEMVKAQAANPDSVHFDANSLEASLKDSVWTVTQTFDRLAPSGQTVTSVYTAVFTLDRSAENGYTPLMLQVDEQVFYDRR